MPRHGRALSRRAIAALAITCTMTIAPLASAATPTVVWEATGIGSGPAVFSADGTALLLVTTAGFELRRAADGVLLGTVTLPAGSQAYDAMALSPDKSLVAISLLRNAVVTIELWRLSNGSLARTITTDATRSIKGLSFSSTGLIASRERFAYAGGGYLRVFRVSDGGCWSRSWGP
jgi:WD40 repeat protein